jgi:hypothetical protein
MNARVRENTLYAMPDMDEIIFLSKATFAGADGVIFSCGFYACFGGRNFDAEA